jgi:hypothetical protein
MFVLGEHTVEVKCFKFVENLSMGSSCNRTCHPELVSGSHGTSNRPAMFDTLHEGCRNEFGMTVRVTCTAPAPPYNTSCAMLRLSMIGAPLGLCFFFELWISIKSRTSPAIISGLVLMICFSASFKTSWMDFTRSFTLSGQGSCYLPKTARCAASQRISSAYALPIPRMIF